MKYLRFRNYYLCISLILAMSTTSIYAYAQYITQDITKDNTTSSIDKNNAEAVSLKQQGDQFFKEGDLAKTIENYEKAISLNPTLPKVYKNLGFAYLTISEYDLALNNFKKAKQQNPSDSSINYYMAQVYVEKRDFDSAINYLNELLSVDSNDAKSYGLLGSIYGEKENYEKAIENIEKALKLDPQNGDYYSELGIIYLKMENVNQAENYFNKALAVDPDNPYPYFNLGSLYENKGDLDTAIKNYINIISNPKVDQNEFIDVYKRLATIYYSKKKHTDAIAVLEKAVLLDDQDVDIHLELGNNYIKTDELKPALESYKKALKLDPGNEFIKMKIALLKTEIKKQKH